MSNITTKLTTSVTLIAAFFFFHIVSSAQWHVLHIYDFVVLPVAFYFMTDRNMVNA